MRNAMSVDAFHTSGTSPAFVRPPHGRAWLPGAEGAGRRRRSGAPVGGAWPIARAVSDGRAGDRLTRIVAVLNGTSNAVLSQMEATRCLLSQAVAEARACGWAEA